jgi:hypothetical protein
MRSALELPGQLLQGLVIFPVVDGIEKREECFGFGSVAFHGCLKIEAGEYVLLRFLFLRLLKGYSAYDPINYIAVNALLKQFFKRPSLTNYFV